MKKILFLIFLIIFSKESVFSENLQLLTNNIYFDIDSVTKNVDNNGKIIKNEYMYVLKSFNTPDEIVKKLEKSYSTKIGYHLVKDVINCKRKTIATKYFGLYDVNGQIVQELTFDNYKQNESLIIPKTCGIILYNEICVQNNYKNR